MGRGGGQAGGEGGWAGARVGARVAMWTVDKEASGRLSCNAAVGGLAKGQLVREIDALGGLMAEVTDASAIQVRRLNTRKGLAVQATQTQCRCSSLEPTRTRGPSAVSVGVE